MEEFFCRIRGNAITQSWLSPTKAFNLEGDPNKDLPPSLVKSCQILPKKKQEFDFSFIYVPLHGG